MLQHVRARFGTFALVPTTLAISGALAFGLVSTAPAQAATATTAPTVTAAVTAAVPSAAQTAALAQARAVRVAHARAVRLAHIRAAKAARILRIRANIVRLARSKVGRARYVPGAAGPNRFDCSGLAMYVYRTAAGISLPHYSGAQFQRTHHISRGNLRPGDLVFFMRNGAHHVAIYIGGGRMVGAANRRSGVRIDSVWGPWYGSHYSGAGRLL